jgi:hypothetical protein
MALAGVVDWHESGVELRRLKTGDGRAHLHPNVQSLQSSATTHMWLEREREREGERERERKRERDREREGGGG